ncbi:hypothetical protein ASPACDRAFT_1883459 [Aspergillus aculeatus ATCC 16872]|uniref:Putative gamma-glutamylcyclotransferase n=1 Tax=Aspergillus aculeatus (strain ATCC 16872 / CBS 172.66 / WB 5094) TaxID=690307 RepID=A0A1L9WGY6_ASPA1|nr:uncharacterized protein ASPACDRAFT_1883459 [Aspergillus aculeatus ATCC 16872]OJJ95451.1 hypothetical protein ASPACDRAFT_1883459 [Aspergillus aculeatus ATCC 16872]
MGDNTLFFYGTLMSPQILHRVIHGHATPEPWQRAYLTIQPAVLPNYRRHRVRHADYPGIVAVAVGSGGGSSGGGIGVGEGEGVGKEGVAAADSLPRDAGKAEADADASSASVLGTLVTGLTEGDVYRLDLFEGDEYTKVKVRVKVMGKGQGKGQGKGRGKGANGVGDEKEEEEEDVRVGLEGLETTAATVPDGVEEEVEALTYVWTAGRERLEDAEWDFEAFKRDKMAWWVEADERDW